jgi:hypothetical protein
MQFYSRFVRQRRKSDTVGLIAPVDYATVGGGVSRHRIAEARAGMFQSSSSFHDFLPLFFLWLTGHRCAELILKGN